MVICVVSGLQEIVIFNMFIYDNLTNDYLPEDTQEQATKVRLEDREFLKLVQ